MRLKTTCVLSVGILFCASLGYSQTSGSITGSIQDAQQAAIPNASITVTNNEQKVTQSVQSESTGRFVFPTLPAGTYDLSVQAAGFKKLERRGITLNADQRLTLGDITLEVGAVTESVEISANTVALQTESAERSDSLVSKQIQNIAVNGRNPLDLVKLLPGVVSTANFQVAGSGGLGSISANGTRTSENQTTINGIGNVDTGSNGGQNVTVSMDSIQEFRVLTSAYQAEYGRSAGAQIVEVTKSGTADFHGSAYWYHRHEGLNANNWKNNRDGLARNKFRFNDLGYTIGGPVIIPKLLHKSSNKLFFFWSQEYQKQLAPNSTKNATVPTALERQGDFSQSVDSSGNPFPYIKDATLNLPCSASNTSGCFAADGVLGRIPQSRLYAPGVALLKFFPLPNAASVANKGFNYQSQISDQAPRREDLLRIDYNINSNMRVFGHFIYNQNSLNQNYGQWAIGLVVPVTPISYVSPGNSWALGHTWTISPSMTNEFTFGTSHNSINIFPATNALTRTASGVNLPVLYPSAVQSDLLPTLSFGGTRIGNSPTVTNPYAPFVNYNTTLDWVDNLNKVVGRHSLKAGIYIQRSRKDQTSFSTTNGNYNFGDNSSNPYDTGFGFANAAIGVYNSFTQANAYLNGMYRYTNLEVYVQDTWKITDRITLDYGLRGAWYQPQYDAAMQTSTFDPSAYDPSKAPRLYQPGLSQAGTRIAVDPASGQTLAAAYIGYEIPNSGVFANGMLQQGKGINKYLMENRGPQWGPRFGMAWDVTGHQNLVVRAGGGMYYDRIQGNKIFDMIRNPPVTTAPTLNYGYAQDINPASALLAPPNVYMSDLTGHVPTVYNYTVSIQSKLPGSFVLDTAYVGSQSRHLPDQLNLNAIPYGATFLPQNQDKTLAASSLAGQTALPTNFLRPYKGLGDITLYENTANSNYNALQVTLNRRFAKGLFTGIAYTWSHALTNVTSDTDYKSIDQYDHLRNYSNASFDRRHNLVANFVYDVPRILSSTGFAHSILDGWQLSGIARLVTGDPFTPGFSISGVNNQNLTGSYTEGARLVVLGNPNTGSDNPYTRVNPAVFGEPQPGNIGTTAKIRYLFNPGINNWDLTLQKTFSVKDRMGVQLRVDAFNAFNHTQFSGINSTLNFANLTNPNPTNLAFDSAGNLVNKNGFGTVSGARDPRILQTVIRFTF